MSCCHRGCVLMSILSAGQTLRTFAIDAVLKKLKAMKEAVEQQTSVRFYSTSLLIAYEGCIGRRGSRSQPLDEDPSEEDSSSVDLDDYYVAGGQRRQQLLPPSPLIRRKRHNSSSGDDEDSMDSSVEISHSASQVNIKQACRSLYSECYQRPARLLFKCNQRQHHDIYSRANPNVDVRMIDFAHTVLENSRNASPVSTPVADEEMLPPGMANGNAKHEGPDKGFLQGLNSLIQLLTEVREEGHSRGEDESLDDSDCDEDNTFA